MPEAFANLAALHKRLADLEGAEVLIWGVGSHGGGLAAARFCAERGARVALLDLRDPLMLPDEAEVAREAGWCWFVGTHRHSALERADLVLASPAIPPAVVQAASVPVIPVDALFFAEHRGARVGVTATKGKSTMARLCADCLDWEVAGNSHEPLLDLLRRAGPEVPVVVELSSFMLWHLRQVRPHFSAGITGLISADHLDWHPTADHYRSAKALLADWSTNHLSWDIPARERVRLSNGRFVGLHGEVIASRTDLPLVGDHNEMNACLAMTAALRLGASHESVRRALRAMVPLPHRLQIVHQADGVRFIDDSAATNPLAAVAGVRSVEGPVVVIAGGSSKGLTYDFLARVWAERLAQVVLIGTNAGDFADECERAEVPYRMAHDMGDAVLSAVSMLGDPPTGTILLSPGCASFGSFRDFADRGRQFTLKAQELWTPEVDDRA